MRNAALLAAFALAACKDTVEDAGSVAYEGPSQLTVSDEVAGDAAGAPSLDGRYGASAADCEPNNRYMTEYLEIDGPTLTYRGGAREISMVHEDSITLRGGERIERDEDTLVRWPDQRGKRTAYTRCR